MKLATTVATGAYKGSITEMEKIDMAAEAGFSAMDFTFWDMKEGDPFLQEGWQELFSEIADYARKKGITFVQAHSPLGNPLNRTTYPVYMQKTVRALECCRILGVPQMVVHSGTHDDEPREVVVSRNVAFYKELMPYAEREGVDVLVENIGCEGAERFYMTTAKDLLNVIRAVDHPRLHALWDVGHGSINGLDPYEELTTLGRELRGLHIHDNYGILAEGLGSAVRDVHSVPGMGNVNFDAVMQALCDIGYKGFFTYEVDAPAARPKIAAGREFPQKTAILPKELKCDYLKLLYKIGRFYLQAYDCFEG